MFERAASVRVGGVCRRLRFAGACAAVAVAAVVGAGCGSDEESGAASAGAEEECAPEATAAIEQYVNEGQVLGKGPYGEKPTSASDIELTPDEIAQVKAMDATAGIVMHFKGDNWSSAQVAALRSEFDRLGIEVVAETSADADVTKQFSDIETVTARRPTIMVSIPSLDVKTLAPAYKKAAGAGINLVFMDNAAQGMRPGTDYVSVVASDYRGFGVINAHQMAKALCGEGTIGVLFHAAKAPNNVAALEGFTETIHKDYPNIEVVAEAGLLGPDFNGQGESNVNSMLAQHPDLNGVWCFFDLPCEGAMNAARALGRDDLVLTMGGLGQNVATDLAAGEFVAGIGSVQPYQQGVVEARLAAYALLGKDAPPYVELPAVPVDKDNLVKAWETVYHADPPASIKKALGG